MSETQLFQAGFYLIMIAACTLIVYLIISFIMYKMKKKNHASESETQDYSVKPHIDNTENKDKDTVDLENKIIDSTEALENEASAYLGNNIRGFLLKDVREIVIPKERMVAVRKGSELDGVLNHLLENDVSCCPVYFRSIDDILGTVSLKGLIRKKMHEEGEIWDDCIENPTFINSSISIQAALNQIRRKKSKIAIVINEYAQTIGIVTEDDIICGILNDNQPK